MQDVIDLGNRVFDQLVKVHGEHPDSRLLFLYGITMGTEWFIPGTNKSLIVSVGGVIKNFSDQTIELLDVEWKELVTRITQQRNDAALVRMRKEYEFTLKDGDTIEFGLTTKTREISFNPLNLR